MFIISGHLCIQLRLRCGWTTANHYLSKENKCRDWLLKLISIRSLIIIGKNSVRNSWLTLKALGHKTKDYWINSARTLWKDITWLLLLTSGILRFITGRDQDNLELRHALMMTFPPSCPPILEMIVSLVQPPCILAILYPAGRVIGYAQTRTEVN